MKNLETTITIQAPAEKVWETLMNFDRYANWNPFIKGISGEPAIENRIEVQIMLGEKQMNMKPVVLENKPFSEFRWKGKTIVNGIFDGEHYFKLSSDGNTTRLVHGEKFTGILSGLIMKMIGKKTHEGFLNMNEALKNEVEQNLKTNG